LISEREIHADVRALLMANTPYQFAHLVKFERPSRPDASGEVSTSANRYTYFTDASRDVIFDDLSTSTSGQANGPQTYIANKLLDVTSIQEATEAQANNCTITLDGNGIGGTVTGVVTITSVDATTWDILWPDNVDVLEEGFREGDKVTFSQNRTGSFNIHTFRMGNVIRVTKIDDNLTPGTVEITMTLSSEEIKSILINKNSSDYASFINREVYIYRAYFVDGQLVGATPDPSGFLGPILLFKGIINSVAFDDDDSGIKVQWALTSHWGDFAQVRGRITSDEFHRALDQNGTPQPLSTIKPEYAYDKGFSHSETSLNLLASYTVMVDKVDVKTKKGWFFGIGSKTKVTTTAVPEGRTTPLDFQLQAKSIPVIYGVRNMSGIPIFADTLKTNSSEVYVVYALSEGEIGGIYDVIIEGKSLICNNKEDFDARSTQTTEGNIDLICRGRADRGDVLGGDASATGSLVNYYYDANSGIDLREVWNLDYHNNVYQTYNEYHAPTFDLPPSSTGAGVIHGESVALTAPQEITLDFFSGGENQKASAHLVGLAASNSFKVQSDYWTGTDTPEYWGPNHRLLDTAYIVAKYIIKEGETTIPSMDFVIRGKVVECYNYDYSYPHAEKATSESADNFLLGDTVTLSTGQNVQIIDKWSFARSDGLIDTRFRFSEAPDLDYINGVPSTTWFTMTKGGSTWTMTAFNWILHGGTVGATIASPATLVEDQTGTTITYDPNTNLPVGGDPTQPSAFYSFVQDNGSVYRNNVYSGSRSSTVMYSEL
jgi:hypothetical protein